MRLNFAQPIILETSRVRLEPLTLQHLNPLLLIAEQEPNLLRYSPSPFGNREKLQAYFEEALQAKESGKRYPFAIFDKEMQAFAGSTSYGSVSQADLRLEIGWTWLGSAFRGTGLNLHCKYLLLSYAFETLKFERVEFKTDSRNLQSRRAIEKIGGIYEGCLRSHTLLPDGYRRHTVYYSILREDWPSVKTSCFLPLLPESS